MVFNNADQFIAMDDMAPRSQIDRVISEYHFHLYFNETTRASAATIRERLLGQRVFSVRPGPLRDLPIGPHRLPQFQAAVLPGALEAALGWYLLHRGEHTVLIHPVTEDELRDHTRDALWLGDAPVALDCSRLDAPGPAWSRQKIGAIHRPWPGPR